jgi:hypothetical protein
MPEKILKLYWYLLKKWGWGIVGGRGPPTISHYPFYCEDAYAGKMAKENVNAFRISGHWIEVYPSPAISQKATLLMENSCK